ncbi:hypothetical protein B0H11DRAFT_2247191 [Mycena galericulata]|nr:hypothetical protein B0H11DRAFT_2247191 [Mycena galericulata]
MANPQNVEKEKEWRGLKLTPILEDEDGSNNYSEFKQKAILDLDAAGYYWKYVAGEDYNPPVIPELLQSIQVQGIDAAGNQIAVTIPGNEAAVDAAKKNAEVWLLGDKKAHALIVKAVPSSKLYIIALKNEYEPSNALTAITIKQQIISYQCSANEDPVNWRQVMIQLYGKLRDADAFMMPDTEFAKHLVTLMSLSDAWRYCRDSLRERVRQGDAMGNPVSSAYVISRMKQEEVEMKIAPSIVSINALITGGKARRSRTGDAVPNVYAAGPPDVHAAGPSGQSSNQNGRKNDKGNQRQGRRPGPYNRDQRSLGQRALGFQ